MKRVLMIAYHFPPMQGSSGIQRTLRFVQHLPATGWEPLVLTAQPRAYSATSPDQLDEIPEGTRVRRAFALDAARHLSLSGRYPKWLALPDRWMSWYPGAVLAGLALICRYRPDAIWSTFPIATAHRIGHTLARCSGLPWIADFRDPMAHEGFPPDPDQWRAYERIERQVLPRARFSVFASPGAAQMYATRYPDAAARIRVIENGYDEASFARLEQTAADGAAAASEQRFVLLHSGVIYPSERDPQPLFAALARLKSLGLLSAADFCLRLRASGCERWLQTLVAEHGIIDLVELAPPLRYEQALREMMDSAALLVMQASNCNAQIPAKLYEYLRSRKPVLALTDPEGDTALTMRAAGLQSIVRLDHVDAIVAALPVFIERVRNHTESQADAEVVTRASRLERAARLSELLNQSVAGPHTVAE
jgi:glycosyltransferase involved in cell wall biosynthesis